MFGDSSQVQSQVERRPQPMADRGVTDQQHGWSLFWDEDPFQNKYNLTSYKDSDYTNSVMLLSYFYKGNS